MKLAAGLVWSAFHIASAFAQCEAPVPCTDPELLALESSECQDYHAFLARGSDSGYPGHQGALIREICSSLAKTTKENKICGYENIVYPANSTAWGPDAWCKSAHKGAVAGQKQMTDYAKKCPDSKLILLGFSQGGSVAFDVLGGGGGKAFECEQESNPRLDRTEVPGSNIVAAVVFGAVRRNPSQNYTVKEGKDFPGTDPRSDEQQAGIDQYSSILREYCNKGDPICAVGSEPSDPKYHLDYFELYNDEAAEWVVKTASGGEVKGNATSASATAKLQGNSQNSKTGAAATTTVGGAMIAGSVAFGALAILL